MTNYICLKISQLYFGTDTSGKNKKKINNWDGYIW